MRRQETLLDFDTADEDRRPQRRRSVLKVPMAYILISRPVKCARAEASVTFVARMFRVCNDLKPLSGAKFETGVWATSRFLRAVRAFSGERSLTRVNPASRLCKAVRNLSGDK